MAVIVIVLDVNGMIIPTTFQRKLMIAHNLSVGEHEPLELPMLFLVLPLSGKVIFGPKRENSKMYHKINSVAFSAIL
jgi:hypothetical protein